MEWVTANLGQHLELKLYVLNHSTVLYGTTGTIFRTVLCLRRFVSTLHMHVFQLCTT